MIRWLIDTNVILRWARSSQPDSAVSRAAVRAVEQRSDVMFVTPQNLIEFWNAATRPESRNGFGWSLQETHAAVEQVKRFFHLAPDDSSIFPEWERLVTAHSVSGVQVHDARLAAVMRVHGLSHILTFNTADFTRYTEITAVRPRDVLPRP